MKRLIVARTLQGYCSIRLEYDNENTPRILEEQYARRLSAQGLVAQGDILSLTDEGIIRASNAHPTRSFECLKDLIIDAQKDGIHLYSIHDPTDHMLEEFGEWNMDEKNYELFCENVTSPASWHHLIDAEMIMRISMAA